MCVIHHFGSEGERNGAHSEHEELGAGERVRRDPGCPWRKGGRGRRGNAQ